MNALPLSPIQTASTSPDFQTNDHCPICSKAFGSRKVDVVKGDCGHKYDESCWLNKYTEDHYEQLDWYGPGKLTTRRCVLCNKNTLPLTRESGARLDETSPYFESMPLQACRTGDVEQLNKVLEFAPSIANQKFRSVTSSQRVDLLTTAAEYGHAECLKALIPFMDNLDICRPNSWETALLLAAQNGHSKCVEALIKAGADVTIESRLESPLLAAVRNGHTECAVHLISAGADINACIGRKREPALCQAVRDNNVLLLEALMALGADVNVRSENDSATPLMFAAELGHTDCLQTLLHHGADPDAGTTGRHKGTTALHMAAARLTENHTRCVEKLLAAGANPNATVRNGSTPLIIAAQQKCLSNMQALINGGANPDLKNNVSVSALHLCADNCLSFSKGVRALIDAGADCNTKTNEGLTPLMLVAQKGHITSLTKLLSAGADVDAKMLIEGELKGGTALHLAAANNHFVCVKQLLTFGANVNAVRESDGATPLHRAVVLGSLDAVKALTSAGADLKIKDNAGHTPIKLAAKHGHSAVKKALSAAIDRKKAADKAIAAEMKIARAEAAARDNSAYKEEEEPLI